MTWDEIERIVRIAAAPLWQAIETSAANSLTREDVLQEGCIAAWLALERVPGSVAGYLVIRARGAMVDAMRRASWVPRSAYDDDDQVRIVSSDSQDADEQPLELIQVDDAIGSIAARRVLEQLQRLPDQQVIVAGMLAEGAAPTAIAERLGVSTSRVSQIKSQLEAWARKLL